MTAYVSFCSISLTQRDLAAEYAIEQYMILSWEFSPWLPAAPGHHGYAFFSPKLPQALDFDGPRHLFAGVMGNFYYCGLYNTETVSNVSPEEWARVLPLAVSISTVPLCFRIAADDAPRYSGPTSTCRTSPGLGAVVAVRTRCGGNTSKGRPPHTACGCAASNSTTSFTGGWCTRLRSSSSCRTGPKFLVLQYQ